MPLLIYSGQYILIIACRKIVDIMGPGGRVIFKIITEHSGIYQVLVLLDYGMQPGLNTAREGVRMVVGIS
jgi:hypothetical protein